MVVETSIISGLVTGIVAIAGWVLALTKKIEKCENIIMSNALLFETKLEEKQRTIDYLITAGADIKKENAQTRIDIEVIKNQNVNIEKQLNNILDILKNLKH